MSHIAVFDNIFDKVSAGKAIFRNDYVDSTDTDYKKIDKFLLKKKYLRVDGTYIKKEKVLA